MVRSKKLTTPVRKKGDPTGQSKAIDEQIAAVEGEVESTGGMPNVGAMPQPQQPQSNDIKTLKEVVLREFPELANRF